MQWSIASSYVFYRGSSGYVQWTLFSLNLPHRQYHNCVQCWINCMSTLCAYYHVYIIHIVDIVYSYHVFITMFTSFTSLTLKFCTIPIQTWEHREALQCRRYWYIRMIPLKMIFVQYHIIVNIMMSTTEDVSYVQSYETSSTLIMPSMSDCIKHHQHCDVYIVDEADTGQ